tara:strand:+ start:26854 stop:27234 length:381 start_codon:yes stop_codon:yes gene_type:complete
MAVLLMASTISWKVEKHYCLGHVMDISLFTPAQDCGMGMDIENEASAKVKDENSCCEDEIIFVEGQDKLTNCFNDFNFDQHLFLVAFTCSYYKLFEFEEALSLPNEHYPPPILVKDIILLDEVFLI